MGRTIQPALLLHAQESDMGNKTTIRYEEWNFNDDDDNDREDNNQQETTQES